MIDKKKLFLIIAIPISFTVLVFLVIFYYIKSEKALRQTPVIITENERRIYSPPIPEKLEFCGERVPLEDFDVRERIDREFLVNTYWHSATLLYLKRANRWFPVIEKILKKNSIPEDFKYMSVAESGIINSVSPDGATGFWQLMEPAAKKYGLEINKEIDERYNIEKSTQAACDYLKEAYSKFGNWTLVAAAYNMGIDGIEKQIERQKTKNYYNMFLNEETYRFVSRIVTLKEIFNEPNKYGFYYSDYDLYPNIETYTVTVNYSINDFADFAKQYGINYKILKIFNPWLRENYLKNKTRKTYLIKIPKSGEITLTEE
ncbi:MAG: lytic transglycosylase domain-containing protein [Ignavibacteriales bacterium]|nr:lytic transglycosylase domain-containing protein [Ignavibacteriales bacterium]